MLQYIISDNTRRCRINNDKRQNILIINNIMEKNRKEASAAAGDGVALIA